jgi:hypothetical protein
MKVESFNCGGNTCLLFAGPYLFSDAEDEFVGAERN